MKIRKMKEKDYSAVDKLLRQLHQIDMDGRPELFVEEEHHYSEEFFGRLISNKEIISIVAESDGEIVGACFVSMMNKSGMVKMKTAYVNEIVVEERYRRTGIGKALFKYAEQSAKKQGAKRIDLMVWEHNKAAMKAYESYGMTPQRYIYEKQL